LLNPLHAFSHWLPSAFLWGRNSHYASFTGRETETQNRTYLRSWSSTSCDELTHGKTLMLGGIGGRRRRGRQRWDGWMASLTQWTWVWVNSGSWWWTGRHGVLRFMGSQRVGHDLSDWTELKSPPWKSYETPLLFCSWPYYVWITINCGKFWKR